MRCSCERYVRWPGALGEIAYAVHCWRLGVQPLWHAVAVFMPVEADFEPEVWVEVTRDFPLLNAKVVSS